MGSLSRWVCALGLCALAAGCDAEQQGDAALSFRSSDADANDAQVIFGSPVCECPECSSYWDTPSGDSVRVYLRSELGENILQLSQEGRFFFGDNERTEFETKSVVYSDGLDRYIIEMKRSFVLPPTPPGPMDKNPVLGTPLEGVLRLRHRMSTVDVRINYCSSVWLALGDPALE